MKLQKISISGFRHMKNIDINIGENITVISGLNGTGKSSVLGMIGQVFDYKGKYKAINGNEFKTKYSEIFKFCPFFDVAGTHEYSAFVSDDNGNIIERKVKSRFMKTESRFRLDVGDRSDPSQKGQYTLDYPVIYLGLRRLFPLAQEREGTIKDRNDLEVSKQYKESFNKIIKDILFMSDDTKPKGIKSPTKQTFFAIETDSYSHLGNSAGQDNLGQIVTALLSFQLLKDTEKSYKGGILLIDELDATLFAGSQIQLLSKLYKYSKILNLQIIFTTHSLEIIEHLESKPERNNVVNFLEARNGLVLNTPNPKLNYIRNKIKVCVGIPNKIDKINLVCEDEITEYRGKNLLRGTYFTKILEIKEGPLGSGTIMSLAISNHPMFKKTLFLLDGDCTKKDEYKNIDRIIFLPGGSFPEYIMYDYIKSLSDNDDFRDHEKGFDKNVCFKGYMSPSGPNDYKSRFKQNKPYFGRGLSKIFTRRKKDHKQETETFIKNVENRYNKII